MRSKGFDGMVCSIAGVLAAIGDRWGLLILRDLCFGISRYDDFRMSSGVTNATLSDRLKHLEANGLIERHLYQSNPPRYEYLLSEKGRGIAPVLAMLAELGDCWGVSGATEPPLMFVNRKSGAPVRWMPIDQDTDEQLSTTDVLIKEGPGADDLIRWRLSCANSSKEVGGKLAARSGAVSKPAKRQFNFR